MPVQGAMSDDHKRRIAEGRAQGAVVRKYLAAINGTVLRSTDVTSQLKKIETELVKLESDPEADVMRKLELIRKRNSLKNGELPPIDTKKAEEEFIAIAVKYSERTGTKHDDWLEMGVAPAVLKKAGIKS